MTAAPAETIARFVLRARRIGAHSLLQDRETFEGLLNLKPTVQIAADGSGTFHFPLPANEEVFESLAARVRPLTLERESIFYPKVLSAIRRLLDASSTSAQQQRDQLNELNAAWKTVKLGQQVQAYAMQGSKLDDTDPTGTVTDTELAAGWMYADLVHADAADWKEKALAFSIRERYLAAVTVFSRIAALAIQTAHFIKHLQEAGALTVDETVWTADVIVGVTEIVYNGAMYLAAPDTEAPPLSESLDQPGGPWNRLTGARLLRTDPANRVQVDMKAADDTLVASYDAAVLHHSIEENVLYWHVLVADCLVLRVQVHGEDNGTLTPSMDVVLTGQDRRTILAASRFQLQSYQATTLVLQSPGVARLTIPLQVPESGESLKHQQDTELLEDLVALEDLTGQAIGTLSQTITILDRVRIRQTRLLWSGKIVQWDRTLYPLISRDEVTPHSALIEPTAYEVGGVQIAIPEIRVGHRDAIWHDEGAAPEFGPDIHRFTATLPDGVTRFLAWSPQTRTAAPDEVPHEGEPWGIAGVDEAECSF